MLCRHRWWKVAGFSYSHKWHILFQSSQDAHINRLYQQWATQYKSWCFYTVLLVEWWTLACNNFLVWVRMVPLVLHISGQLLFFWTWATSCPDNKAWQYTYTCTFKCNKAYTRPCLFSYCKYVYQMLDGLSGARLTSWLYWQSHPVYMISQPVQSNQNELSSLAFYTSTFWSLILCKNGGRRAWKLLPCDPWHSWRHRF